ncbi:unnamed protein product [Rhizoctonia solani]|uniref:Uncharacterized protein n=1 Tax=Rhizoctonia solani TaxID=456999 RepID=A0A8H2XY31_9AGAM|nr:unnamed protein product [Rhizoctonia solani]CAE6506893.1 unnamed protein product [Rhizoctonia solani]
MAVVHPIWGRNIHQYPCSYTLGSLVPELTAQSVLNSANTEAFGRAHDIIVLISKVGEEADPSKAKLMAQSISLEMLQSVLAAASFRTSFSALAEPRLVRGCIRIMSTVALDTGSSASPFSYEYGYVCFCILTIAFGLCFVGHSLDTIFRASDTKLKHRHPLVILAESVASTAGMNVHLSATMHYRNLTDQTTSVIAPREGLLLFNMLWGDRKLFLKAMVSTYVPGLSGVMHLLWQLWRVGRANSTDYDLLLGVPLYEVLRRCYLGVTRDQDRALTALISDTQCMADLWLHRSTVLDAEDSKTLLQGYIRRVTSPEIWHGGISVTSVSSVLEFVVRFAQQGAVEMFPPVFATTIRFLWNEANSNEQVQGDEVGNLEIA